ncbi:hypothetical protein BLNAU_13632 [Blattamonas nauphoetae]|nr:hypothetical protein BLNAU_13632 [Blattamonas nauphoetae]
MEHMEYTQNESEQGQLDNPPIVLRLRKRNVCTTSQLQDQPSSQSPNSQMMDIDTILVALGEEQQTDILDLLVALHRMTGTDDSCRRLVQHNTIPLLSQLLVSSQDEEAIFLILSILTDIAALPTDEVHPSFDDNLLQAIIGLAPSTSLDVMEMAWWFLDNYALIGYTQNEFVDNLVRLGIFEVFIPALIQLHNRTVQQPAWHLWSKDLIANTSGFLFPLMTKTIPDHQNSCHHILRTIRHLAFITRTPITADLAYFIFMVFVSGCSLDIVSAIDVLHSEPGLLQEHSSVLYQSPMPPFFPQHIQSFPQLAVSLLSYACEGLSNGYRAFTVLNQAQTRNQISESQKKVRTIQSSSEVPDEEILKKQIVTELDNYFHIARKVLHMIGTAMSGSTEVVDLYLNAGLVPLLGECVRVVQTIQRDRLSHDCSLLTLTTAELTKENPGDLWRRTLEIILSLDCITLATEEKQHKLVSSIHAQYHDQYKLSNIFPKHMKEFHHAISHCLSNISGSNEFHSLRLLKEAFPEPHSSQMFLRFVSDRLVDDTSSSFCADLLIVHGLFHNRSASIYAEIEKSQVLAALFAFKWYRHTHPIADTSLCIFFEILVAFILNAPHPCIIFDYVQDDVIEQKLLKSTTKMSKQTMETMEIFHQHFITLKQPT